MVKQNKVGISDLNFMDEFVRRQLEGKLFRAIAAHRFKLAIILVEGGVDVNCSLRTGITPLMIACDQQITGQAKRLQRHLVRLLLSNNADINAKDNLGRTALAYAFLSGDLQLIRLFEVYGSGNVDIVNRTNQSSSGHFRNSVMIASNLGNHFHRWESADFQNALTERNDRNVGIGQSTLLY